MPNHLAKETSPYLQQHANNPVDWYAWNEAVLEKAKAENKPILLSIGYSACHWCHVMAHESFEDEETANLMNENFINIKVDREERPDLDKIYQTAHQILTQRPGGWPLTVFLTPDLVPFFAGTYFPLQPMHGLPSFRGLLRSIAQIYQEKPDEIAQQNKKLLQMLQNINPREVKSVQFDSAPIKAAIDKISKDYDNENGGFGGAPKFPQISFLQLLLHDFLKNRNTQALAMFANSLTKMAEGGIYDQLGGGFFRYSVDAAWQIPHFEKMLYDNALLLDIYIDAYLVTQNSLFKQVAHATATWVMQRMQSEEGGYFATLDADSEGQEGKYYTWDREEIKKLLSPEQYKIAEHYFGLDRTPHFEHVWHLSIAKTPKTIAQELKLPLEKIEAAIEKIKEILLKERNKHIPPFRDEKIITAWNALTLKAMAKAGKYIDPIFLNSAERAFHFIQKNLFRNELFAVYKDGKAPIPAYLDDYVFLIEAILALLQSNWNLDYFNFAQQLTDYVLQHFQDKALGGFYFTADNHEKLIFRPKNYTDEMIPSGNGVAALILIQLGYLTGNTHYLKAAEKTLQSIWPLLQKFPEAFATLLLALAELLNPSEIIVLRGEPKTLTAWQAVTQQNYDPLRLEFSLANNSQNLPDFLAKKSPVGDAVAYICHGYQCLAPITELTLFAQKIKHK